MHFPTTRLAREMMITTHVLERSDFLPISISGITDMEEITFFSIALHDTHTTTSSYNYRMSVTYRLNMDLHITSRSVYTAFDLLGNVGGLIGVLVGVGAFIVGMLDY